MLYEVITLIGMRLRRVPPATIVTARISSVKAGLLIGGVLALIAAGAVGALMRPSLEPDRVVASYNFV